MKKSFRIIGIILTSVLLFAQTTIKEKDNIELIIQNGHTGEVNYVVFSPDGKMIATASSDQTAKLWSLDGKVLTEFKGHIGSIDHLSFSPDGKILATASQDNTVKLWNLGGKLLADLKGHTDRICRVVFSPNGKILATASWDGSAKLWSLNGKLLIELKMPAKYVNWIAFSPDGGMIATTTDDYIAKLWNLNGELVADFTGNYITFSPDGKKIATTSNRIGKLWNLKGELLTELKAHTDFINSITFSPDGRTLLTSSRDNTVKLWGLNGKLISDLIGKAHLVRKATFSPDGKIFAIITFDNRAKIFSLKGELIADLKGHTAWLSSITFSSNGQTVATSSFDETVKLWNLQGRLLADLKGHIQRIDSIIYSPDEKIFATTTWDVAAKLWSIDGKLIANLKATSIAKQISISSDGKYLATASNDGKIKIWNSDGKLLVNLKENSSGIFQISFSPNENILIVTYGDGIVKVWNLNGELMNKMEGHTSWVNHITFSPNGKIMITSSDDGTIKLWSLDGKLLNDIKVHTRSVNNVSFSKDGTFLATASNEGSIKLLDLDGVILKDIRILGELRHKGRRVILSPNEKTFISYSYMYTKLWSIDGKLLTDLKGDNGHITVVTYSHDGKNIIAGSEDNTIVIWDVESQRIIQKLISHTGGIRFLHFINKGKVLVTSSDDHTIKYWNPTTGTLLATQVFLLSGESLFFTPDNYYMVTDQSALRAVSFKKENKIYDFDQFDLKFNCPDIIMERMRGLFLNKQEQNEDNNAYNNRVQDYENKIALYRNYYEHRIKQNGFKLEQLSGENKIHAPEVSEVKVNNQDVESKGFDSKTKKQKVKLSFTIEDEKGSNLDVVGYKVFVQGVPLHGQYMKNFPTPVKRKTEKVEITLSTIADIGEAAGTNKIEIVGYTSDGIESSKYRLYLHYESENPNKKGNLYVVTLGTKDFLPFWEGGPKKINFPIKDAEDIQTLFKEKNDKEKTYNPKIISIQYTNKEITRERIKEIRNKLNESDVDDTVIFFLSSHGVRTDTPISIAEEIGKQFGISQNLGEPSNKEGYLNVYYYMTSETISKKPWENGIPMELFRLALDGIKARQKILLIDTCQSGEIVSLTDYNPSQQRIDEIKKLKENCKNQSKGKGIIRVEVEDEKERNASEENFYRNFVLEWELRELSKMFPELRRGTGTIEMSAAYGNQSAIEYKNLKNGAFTFAIKEAILEGKAKDGTDITAKSLRKCILDQVERLTEGRQIPMVTRDISGRDFRIAK